MQWQELNFCINEHTGRVGSFRVSVTVARQPVLVSGWFASFEDDEQFQAFFGYLPKFRFFKALVAHEVVFFFVIKRHQRPTNAISNPIVPVFFFGGGGILRLCVPFRYFITLHYSLKAAGTPAMR